MQLSLEDVWRIASPADYKCHFARWNGENQPLDVWVRDKMEWQQWQEYRPARNDFNRPLIFSLMQFYHEPDAWLFGGIFRVLERLNDRYVIEIADEGKALIGRLKLSSPYRKRQTRVNFENHLEQFGVLEILREPYSGRTFPGYGDIDLSFEELEALIRNGRSDWSAPLANVKGIYLISDTITGKRYVGSAYGDKGIWSRWREYVATGHGGNTELRALAIDPTLSYCRKAFRFALLEYRPVSTPDDMIIAREAFWKRILLTRGEHGLNRN